MSDIALADCPWALMTYSLAYGLFQTVVPELQAARPSRIQTRSFTRFCRTDAMAAYIFRRLISVVPISLGVPVGDVSTVSGHRRQPGVQNRGQKRHPRQKSRRSPMTGVMTNLTF